MKDARTLFPKAGYSWLCGRRTWRCDTTGLQASLKNRHVGDVVFILQLKRELCKALSVETLLSELRFPDEMSL